MASQADNYDTLIIGGGVIGLSLAWELAKHGERVGVVDRGQLGMEASWAGAGMVPAGPGQASWPLASSLERLEGLSQRLHPEWHQALRERTGIDSQYRQCGTLHLATDAAAAARIQKKIARWRELGIPCNALDTQQIAELEPALASQADQFLKGYYVSSEAQFRSPRLLKALIAACQIEGVQLRPGITVERFASSAESLTAAVTSQGPIHADRFCIATGCWTGQFVQSLGLDLLVRPIRGQIVLLDGPPGLFRHNVYIGMRYFTPRLDGRLLVGSTLEDAGFHKENTAKAIADLMHFATSFAPLTSELAVEQRWAGLRPGTVDDLPYLGRIPHLRNAWLASGHFRAGLQLAPATAVVMRCLMRGEDSPIDVSSLGVER